MKTLKTIGITLFVLFFVLIVAQNFDVLSKSEVFQLDLMAITLNSPPLQLYFLICVSFLFGFLLAYFSGLHKGSRLKRTIRELTKARAEAEEELNLLRNLPITEPKVSFGRPMSETERDGRDQGSGD